jgi:hypothetical protein
VRGTRAADRQKARRRAPPAREPVSSCAALRPRECCAGACRARARRGRPRAWPPSSPA